MRKTRASSFLQDAEIEWSTWERWRNKEDDIGIDSGREIEVEETSFHNWEKPKEGYMKINYDASYDRLKKESIGAAICKDDQGRNIGAAYRSFKVPSAEDAEIRAAEVAVMLAKELKLARVLIEGDNETVTKALQRHEWNGSWNADDNFKNILYLSEQFESISFLWCNRLANCNAHDLAKWAKTREGSMPACVENALRPLFRI